ncbi:MAG TPA: ABC transporter permease [Candidatus Acidoferrales bacterium]|nr:ABC transporter permease [Candidatus Acidoferrales bacterium]
MRAIWQDIRFGLRMLVKSPGFALVAVLTLALGIGANTAIFGVVKQVLLQPLGMQNPGRLVMLWPRNLLRNDPKDLVTPGKYEDWRRENHVFSEMAAATDQSYTLTGLGEPELLISWSISSNFMHLLGVEPTMGRMFTQEEEQAGHNHVVVLTNKLWVRRFGEDRNVLGKTITLNDMPYTVIGVMPRGFNFPGELNDLWAPLVMPPDAAANRTATFLRVVARLKDGLTMKQAEADIEQLSERLGQQYPDTDKGWGVGFQPVRDLFVGGIRPPLLALTGAVGFVLLIVCANVANLLLARAAARRKEMAIRVALGATRGRLIRQLLTESVMTSLAGCLIGLMLTVWATRFLVHLFPNNIANLNIPLVEEIPVDSVVLGFAVLLAVVTGIVFGAVPALQVSGASPEPGLKESGGRTIGSGGSRLVRSGLVVAQVSLALVLLTSAGLMIKSFVRLQNTSLGFNPGHVMTAQVLLPRSRYKTDPDRIRFVREVLAEMHKLPGVESAAAVNFLPLSGFWGTVSFTTPDAAPVAVSQWPSADYRIASDDYFRTMQIPILRGRSFTGADTAQNPPVCIINATLARRYFANQDAVGRLVTPDPNEFGKAPWLIVGVVGDVKHFGAAEAAHPEVYRPFTQDGFPLIAFTARTGQQPMALAGSLRQAIWTVDKDQAIFRELPMEEAAWESSALRRMSMIIFAFFAATALALSALGIYGVVSYLVAQRTREIGIRMALGARRGAIVQMVVGQTFRVAAIGLVLGVAGALAVTRFLASLLFQVRALDSTIFVAVPAVLCAVALLAAWVPAQRAARIDPVVALRYE